MARARNIKPGFFTNDELVSLPFEVRLLFIGLWTIADKAGRLIDRPKKIKMEVFPGDNVDCDLALSKLNESGFIRRYWVNGVAYIQIVNWSKHQNPHIKEANSVIPEEAPEFPDPVSEIPEQARLIPSSLIPSTPINPLSGIPDDSPKNGKEKLSTVCKEIIAFLNTKTGRRYRPVKANLSMIAARIKEGATPMELRQVIAKKCREWGADEKMEPYLRPATLFNATNFAQYQGELGEQND